MSFEQNGPDGSTWKAPRVSESCGGELVRDGNYVLTFADVYEGQPHYVARTELNAKLVALAESDLGIAGLERIPVADEHVDWAVELPGYNPPHIDIPRGRSSARKPGDCPDPADPNEITHFNSIFTDRIARDAAGRPLNPIGRTGLQGRGMLDKWGETPAADLLVTRYNPITGVLEIAAVQRADTGEWALPGGKVDPGESPEQAAVREFMEEAGGEGMDFSLAEMSVVFAGYMDDSRNTDNAWMSSTCIHKHLSPEEAQTAVLRADSDAVGVAWVSPQSRFFASHGPIVREVLRGYLG